MKDYLGREIDYLRISVTDRCNLNCVYCMPDKAVHLTHSEILTYEEIERICACATSLGIKHIKVTGGEPLVRKGCVELIENLKKLDGIETVTLTTNGVLLEQYLDELKSANLDGINISLDTDDKEKYRAITGYDNLDKVRNAILASMNQGLKTKINTVALGGLYENEWKKVLLFAKEHPVDVRFIEMMPIGMGRKMEVKDNVFIQEAISNTYGKMIPVNEKRGYGPAVYYQIAGFQGKVGFISAVHRKFCASCNRVRLTSTGFLKSCLCYDTGNDLKAIIRNGCSEEELTEVIRQTIWNKPEAHCFGEQTNMTEKHSMNAIGG